jgi:hypothetical protein
MLLLVLLIGAMLRLEGSDAGMVLPSAPELVVLAPRLVDERKISSGGKI